VLEALPGLYGPQAFLRGIADAEDLFKSLNGKSDQERMVQLAGYYQVHANKLSAAFMNDTLKIGGKAPQGFTLHRGQNGEVQAISIAALAITKSLSEVNVLRAMNAAPEALGKMTDELAWRKIARLNAADAILDAQSLGLIRKQNPALSDRDFGAMVEKFQESIALDTVRNEYLLHTKLYPWLLRDPNRTNLERFNEKVYAELFLTPRSDPWLGLLDKDVYVGVDNGGIK